MPRARSETVDLASTPYYHCISRCVRRAFLCGRDEYTGQDYEHRRAWVVERLWLLSEVFAIELYAYAVMSNHLHVVIRVDQDAARRWDDDEVVERYARLFPGMKEAAKNASATQRRELCEKWRERLCSVSWFMRCLNEHIARRANKEDDCKGRFWEGRFKSQPLLDEEALLTCMAYVDLNPVRSGNALNLEQSEHTSIALRLEYAEAALDEPNTKVVPPQLAPFDDQVSRRSKRTRIPMSFLHYVELLEWTGRRQRAVGPAGFIRGDAPALLQKLKLDPTAWLRVMEHQGLRTLTVLGSVEALDEFAESQGKHWVHGKGLARALAAPVGARAAA